MLELRNITKIYPLGEGEVRALRGIDLSFRKSEFVSTSRKRGLYGGSLLPQMRLTNTGVPSRELWLSSATVSSMCVMHRATSSC